MTDPSRPWYAFVDSPFGRVLVSAGRLGLCRVVFMGNDERASSVKDYIAAIGAVYAPEKVRRYTLQIGEYFAGERKRFDLRLDVRGTKFQETVWGWIAKIPYGETWTYGEVAAKMGNPNAARTVGRAAGANPVPIVIPCHRVIGADGSLVGFGSGVDLKKRLLQLEGVESGE